MNANTQSTYLEQGLIEPTPEQSPLWVIPKDLCTRCGSCHVICPTNVVRFDDHDFPYIQTEGCINCGLCLKVCPGIDFDMQKLHQEMFHTDYQTNKMSGVFQKAYVGHSNMPGVRRDGTAGGVVTHLLIFLLKTGMVDGVIVVGNDPNDPTMPMPYIARTEDEVRAAAQSKYVAVANTKVLREIRGSHEKFAMVGVACQIHGLKKLEELNKRLAERVVLTIGLACRGTLEKEAIRDLVEVQGIRLDDLKRVSHRGGPFPGKFQAHYDDGRVRDLHHFEYKDGAYNMMLRMYLPDRCHLCPDYAADFADITCSDMWLRGRDGKYLHPHGSTLFLCRTEKGMRVIEAMVQAGDLALEEVDQSIVEKSYEHLKRERKIIPFLRVLQRQQAGKRAPNYGVDAQAVVSSMSWRDRLYERIYRRTFVFTRYPRLRRLILRLLLSPLGVAFVFLKIRLKQVRGALKARRSRRVSAHTGA